MANHISVKPQLFIARETLASVTYEVKIERKEGLLNNQSLSFNLLGSRTDFIHLYTLREGTHPGAPMFEKKNTQQKCLLGCS